MRNRIEIQNHTNVSLIAIRSQTNLTYEAPPRSGGGVTQKSAVCCAANSKETLAPKGARNHIDLAIGSKAVFGGLADSELRVFLLPPEKNPC